MKMFSSLKSALFISALVLIDSVSNAAVVELTDATFEHQTQASTGQTTGKWFVKFYAPWCGHCKNLAPTWDELSAKVEEENASDGIIIAKVDLTENKEVQKRFQIQSLPTLKYFADRKMFNYNGGRTLEELHKFVTGGYLADGVETEEIPAPPGWMDIKMKKLENAVEGNEFLKTTLEDFREILDFRKNAAAVLFGLGVMLGVLFGMIIGITMASGGGSKSDSKKKRQ